MQLSIYSAKCDSGSGSGSLYFQISLFSANEHN